MHTTPLSSMAWVLTGSFIGSFGAVFLKSGADKLHLNLRSLIANWQLPMGVFAFLISSLFYLKGIEQGELSVLYPLVSVGYLWTLLWSRLFFGEPLTRMKLYGLSLILLGSLFLGLGNR